MAFADGEVGQVRSATDIVALISETSALKKSGRRWTGLCPFHAEKSPSFSVNAEEGYYYCFGCGAKGDAITFVREVQGLDFRDALQFLADKAGIELKEDEKSGPQRRDRAAHFEAMNLAVEWYHDRLLNSPDAGAARQYLRSRGIDGETVRAFKLGYAPDEWDALASAIKVPATILEGTGLGFTNSRGRVQDALRARVIFPISDTSGRPIAMGGRILPGAPPRADGRTEAKYKNSPETQIYSKRRTLYGLNLAKEDIIKSGEIIVCEGYTDVIGMFQVGLRRAVATCGTALSEEHFRMMRNFAPRIVLAYDADGAGQSAAASVYQWERQHEVEVAVVQMPAGSDPGQLAQSDPDLLRSAVAHAIPFLQFRLNRVLAVANMTTAEGRAAAAERAVDVVAEHPTDLVRDQYIQQVADALRLSVESLRPLVANAVRRGPRPVSTNPRATAVTRPTRVTNPGERTGSRSGITALQLAVHAPESVEGRVVAAYFVDADQRSAFEALADGRLTVDAIEILESRGEDAAAQILQQVLVDEFSENDTNDHVVQGVVAQLLRAAVAVALRDIERELRSGAVTAESALAVIKDVKNRLTELDGDQATASEKELREWLVNHDGARE